MGRNWSLKVCASYYPPGLCSTVCHNPPCKQFQNHNSARQHQEFVEESILSLEERGCVREVSDCEVCSPLGAVDNGKKLRLILHLRYVNKHLAKFKFKLEDMKIVLDVYRQGDYLVTFNLKSGYNHTAITKKHRDYLGFTFMIKGKVKKIEFCVLPFGLSFASYAFTKVTRPLVSSWRQ